MGEQKGKIRKKEKGKKLPWESAVISGRHRRRNKAKLHETPTCQNCTAHVCKWRFDKKLGPGIGKSSLHTGDQPAQIAQIAHIIANCALTNKLGRRHQPGITMFSNMLI